MIPDSYFERFSTPKYRNENPMQRALIRRFVDKLHGLFIEAQPVGTVLEVGVGEGFLSGYLSEKFPEKHFTGVDLSQGDLDRLKDKFPRIETRCLSIYDLGQLGARYDLVICAEVLEHVDDPDRALRALVELSPRHLILTVPHEPFFMLSNLARGKNVRRFGNDEEHINHWGVRGFRKLLERHVKLEHLTTSYPWILALGAPH